MFKPGWKMTVFTLLFAPLLFWLGNWQLDREQEKIQLQREYDERSSAEPLSIDEVHWKEEKGLGFLKISALGQYDNEQTFLLDNKIHEGKVGYEVLSPFRTEQGQNLLVNRGWVAMGRTRMELPKISPVVGIVTIQGNIYVPLEESFMLNTQEEISQNDGVTVIQSIDMSRIKLISGGALAPYSIRLLEGSPGVEKPNWKPINMLPEKHRAYAVQWFALLTALIAMFVYFGFKNPKLDPK